MNYDPLIKALIGDRTVKEALHETRKLILIGKDFEAFLGAANGMFSAYSEKDQELFAAGLAYARAESAARIAKLEEGIQREIDQCKGLAKLYEGDVANEQKFKQVAERLRSVLK